jgi:hypothetical protein
MTLALPFSLTDAALGRAMSLIVVDPDGVQYEIKTTGPAARYLSDAWSRTLEELGDRELVRYTPEVVIRAGERRALVIADDLRIENEIIGELLGRPGPGAGQAQAGHWRAVPLCPHQRHQGGQDRDDQEEESDKARSGWQGAFWGLRG